MKVEICRGKTHWFIKKKKKKLLKVIVLLACGVCPHGWDWIMWCFRCPLMFSWLGQLMPVFWLMELDLISMKGWAVSSSRFWGVYGFSVSLGSVRRVYFHSYFKVALSGYFHCCQPKTCPWNLCQCFCSLVPPFTAGQILLGRGLCGSFLDSLTVSSVHRYVCGLLSAPWACPLCCRAYVHLSQLIRPNTSYISFHFRIQLLKWKSPIIETILEYEHTAAAAAKSLQSCPTLCNPIDGSPPGSPVPGILQARTLERVAISFSNAWKWKVKVKSLSHVQLLATPRTAAYQTPPSMGFSKQEYWSGVPLPSPWTH